MRFALKNIFQYLTDKNLEKKKLHAIVYKHLLMQIFFRSFVNFKIQSRFSK